MSANPQQDNHELVTSVLDPVSSLLRDILHRLEQVERRQATTAPPPPDPKLLYSVKDFAELSGLKVSTIRTYIKKGIINAAQWGGKDYRIPHSEIKKLKP